MQTPKKVGVLGAGTMGAEIALCFSVAGASVVLKDVELALAEKGKARLAKVVDKAVEKGRFPAEERDAVLDRIVPTGDYEPMADADLVVEAVFEKIELKKAILSEADQVCKPECVLATNTSSIPITLLSTAVSEARRPRFVGAHFFAPAFVMKLVEVIPGLETSDETVDVVMEACRQIKKNPILVKDTAGFVVNRMLFALFNEAVRLVDEGVASCEDIDTGCRLGLGHPLGPFALMDMADLEMALDVSNLLKDAHGDRFRFGTALKQRVYAGHRGKRFGRGWYAYDKKD
ncbi:3-hydroxyacyl-CoA dehydrogenase family protein [Desulfosarcina ovata]|uniref:3-hydroxybutyryl-CoA dehydrogenase n=1 Tax=Desulfosarcina ovata subsp. ovata TaxID=2752305 RepID=A0A5K8AL85_9BACT|nr:3-hydroxyacyl-CoA dehydrogenase family protein [Desulfosarcina ovata]BBO93442.1 3-hydroxybutyryl-CoA dehydrogenase [Desulfosarcina ovata subsp. ovata]